MPRRRVNRRRMKRARRARVARVPRHVVSPLHQSCSIVETISGQVLAPNTVLNNYFNLTQFRRAHYMSAGFAFYRAKRVTYTYQPLFNTFEAGEALGSTTVPYMYKLMNRQDDANLPNSLYALQACGTRPIKFTSQVKVSYKPNWLLTGPTAVLNSITPIQMGYTPTYVWIAKSSAGQTMFPSGSGTNRSGNLVNAAPNNAGTSTPLGTGQGFPDLVNYVGHNTYFTQETAVEGSTIARVIITVEWEFKDPIWNSQITQSNLSASEQV